MSSLRLIVSYLLFGFCSAFPVHGAADPLSTVEKAAEDWVKTRAETVRLATEWASERPLLESTVAGLRDRAVQLEQKRDEVKAKSAKERTELDGLAAKNKIAADELQLGAARLQTLTQGLLQLRAQLPPRLSDALEMSFRSLARADLGPGERMQFAITILNRCAQFDRAVSCDEEVLNLPEAGGSKSYEVIYWGLSHGYAVDRAAQKAWAGVPGPAGWQWEARPTSAASLGALISVYHDQADPSFINVPARLTHPLVSFPNKS
jgi:uncharacterized protein DUF3450